MKKIPITFRLNGERIRVTVNPSLRLIDLLREELGLTGTKEGCGIGECGACTVIMDTQAVASCLVLAGQIEGCEIITIEGIGSAEELDPIQHAILRNHAVQCGFCTPGFIMSAKALLLKNPTPTREEIQVAISGNLCRCTGYEQLIQAIYEAAQELQALQHGKGA